MSGSAHRRLRVPANRASAEVHAAGQRRKGQCARRYIFMTTCARAQDLEYRGESRGSPPACASNRAPPFRHSDSHRGGHPAGIPRRSPGERAVREARIGAATRSARPAAPGTDSPSAGPSSGRSQPAHRGVGQTPSTGLSHCLRRSHACRTAWSCHGTTAARPRLPHRSSCACNVKASRVNSGSSTLARLPRPTATRSTSHARRGNGARPACGLAAAI